MPTFSERYNLRTTDVPITIQYEAPDDFRVWLIECACSIGLSIDCILTIICQKTFRGTDGNWGADFKKNEAIDKLRSASWPLVYDVAEALFTHLTTQNMKQTYVSKLNSYFLIHGYGWKFENGIILYRGSATEDASYQDAINVLVANPTAKIELTNALHDLSRRPDPDLSGTVHHALAAVECLARDIFNAPASTLGDIIKKNKAHFTSPLDIVIDKLWGYASNHGRHMGEGTTPSFAEAQFVLYASSAIIIFLKDIFRPENYDLL